MQPDHVVGVLKAYSTCVGAGPFVAENAMPEEWKESLRKAGGEYGAATGRPRRVGPFDAVASRYGLKCQRADKIALTKLDVLSYMQEIPIITGYLYKGKETDTFGSYGKSGRISTGYQLHSRLETGHFRLPSLGGTAGCCKKLYQNAGKIT